MTTVAPKVQVGALKASLAIESAAFQPIVGHRQAPNYHTLWVYGKPGSHCDPGFFVLADAKMKTVARSRLRRSLERRASAPASS